VWKPDAKTLAAFEQLPKEMISVAVTDPRPTVKQLLALGPVVAGMVRSFFPDTKFDIGTLPNGLEATRFLFPNVSVVTRTDTMIRQESRSRCRSCASRPLSKAAAVGERLGAAVSSAPSVTPRTSVSRYASRRR